MCESIGHWPLQGRYPKAFELEFRPYGSDLGLEAGIWASKLGFGPRGWDLGIVNGI